MSDYIEDEGDKEIKALFIKTGVILFSITVSPSQLANSNQSLVVTAEETDTHVNASGTLIGHGPMQQSPAQQQ